MREQTKVPQIVLGYRRNNAEPSRDTQKDLFWCNEIKMIAEAVCDVLRIKETYFLAQADVHGIQTANMIASGEIEVPESAWISSPFDIDLKALAEKSPVSYQTLLRRYKAGDRDERLVRPRDKPVGRGKR